MWRGVQACNANWTSIVAILILAAGLLAQPCAAQVLFGQQ